jgi:hypothetical protein
MVAYIDIIPFLVAASLLSSSIALALAPQPPSNRKRHGAAARNVGSSPSPPAGTGSRDRNVGRSPSPPTGSGTGSRDNNEGRSRYSNSRRDGPGSDPKHRNNQNKNAPPRTGPVPGVNEKQELPPPPSLTVLDQPRPWYFTCRHTYEATLVEEIHRYDATLVSSCSSPFPGIVRVEPVADVSLFSDTPTPYDPVYALQSLPNAVIVSATSIKGLAREIYSALLPEQAEQEHGAPKDSLRVALRQAPRGSLALHALVPGMGKGQTDPVMLRRSTTIASTLADMLKKEFGAARKAKAKLSDDDDDNNRDDITKERYVLQVMLLTPEVAAASLTQCHYRPSLGTWPNWQLPAGLADADVEGSDIPSSAYRKLLEALDCMGCHPTSTTTVVDLGAAPGGWTAVLRRLGCRVIAVDRSELAPNLMKDRGVEFVKGDAFTFVPTLKPTDNPRWMVSDIIAYPDKIQELLEQWCSGHWASHLVVTVKFQGEMPAWEELDKCIQIAESHGYECRAKHFFNNKHEVTLMAVERSLLEDTSTSSSEQRNESDILGKSIYPLTLPAS